MGSKGYIRIHPAAVIMLFKFEYVVPFAALAPPAPTMTFLQAISNSKVGLQRIMKRETGEGEKLTPYQKRKTHQCYC